MTENKRHNYVMKDFLVPIVVAVVMGLGASFLSIKYNEGETVAWRASIESQLAAMNVIMKAVQTNQLELASRGQWMTYVDRELNDHDGRLVRIESTRFSKEDADVTTKHLEREIELIWKEIDNK